MRERSLALKFCRQLSTFANRTFGIKLSWEDVKTPSLGVKTSSEGNELKLATVFDGGAAQAAGLAAGDVLLAFNGLRITTNTLDKQLARQTAGNTVELHAFRRDELMRFQLRLDSPAEDSAKLSVESGKHPLRRDWLKA